MTCKSAIYTVNQTNTAITTAAGTFVQIPFGSVIRRFGQSLALDGGSIVLLGQGYFDVDCSLSITPTAAGPVNVRILQDGMLIPGLAATVTGAADTATNVSLTGLARNCGCDCNSVLTIWIDAPVTVNNMAVVVEKL